ncbi:Protein of unknown function [Bacillus mobilis]|nr:Protein of unknown function [Bacillus mobilis]
MVKTRNSAF